MFGLLLLTAAIGLLTLPQDGITVTLRAVIVFDPLTKARAGGKPRVLINGGFGTHESLELIQFCLANHIILCRLPSHTSHKLQPCDVGPFGPLKTAYREDVERLYRGGSNMTGKQHFTLLYDRARRKPMNSRNILSGWSKTGLRPLNPERVLKEIQKPPVVESSPSTIKSKTDYMHFSFHTLETPKTADDLAAMRRYTELSLAGQRPLDARTKSSIQKVASAGENGVTDRALHLDQISLLFAQNNEKAIRTSV